MASIRRPARVPQTTQRLLPRAAGGRAPQRLWA